MLSPQDPSTTIETNIAYIHTFQKPMPSPSLKIMGHYKYGIRLPTLIHSLAAVPLDRNLLRCPKSNVIIRHLPTRRRIATRQRDHILHIEHGTRPKPQKATGTQYQARRRDRVALRVHGAIGIHAAAQNTRACTERRRQQGREEVDGRKRARDARVELGVAVVGAGNHGEGVPGRVLEREEDVAAFAVVCEGGARAGVGLEVVETKSDDLCSLVSP